MKVSVLKTAPTVEPITLTEAKSQVRLNSSNTTYDTELTSMITAARQWVENRYRISIITQTLVQNQDNFYESFDRYPLDGVASQRYYTRFPVKITNNPVQSITTVKYIDTNGTQQTLSGTTDYATAGLMAPVVGGHRSVKTASIYPVNSWPTFKWVPECVEITYVAGFGPDETYVPELVKNAVKRVLTMYFENRLEEGTTGDRLQFKLIHDVDMIMSGYQTFDNANIYA